MPEMVVTLRIPSAKSRSLETRTATLAQDPPRIALLADDPRDPSYYEYRAGYNMPTTEWFYSGSELGDGEEDTRVRTRPTYSKMNLVRGFNMRLGDSYRLRESTAEYVVQRNLHTANLGTTDAKWDIEDLVARLKRVIAQHTEQQTDMDPISAYWKYCMLRDFVARTARWAKKHKLRIEKGKIANLPGNANWKFGPSRKSAPFAGMFQRQHLTLLIQVPGDGFSILVSNFLKPTKFTFV